jgi:hypothetical protein
MRERTYLSKESLHKFSLRKIQSCDDLYIYIQCFTVRYNETIVDTSHQSL